MMLPLFVSGLLSYFEGMKRWTCRCFTCTRDNSHFLCYLKNLFIMPLGFFLISCIVSIRDVMKSYEIDNHESYLAKGLDTW